ncbi:MAG: NAD(+) synthase, partial [Lentisphaeria bacterium]|nr:NAD(+) synthase [Lentisphaeria bacterium]
TYNGDHMSMYAVNSGVPKTLVRHLVSFYADAHGGKIASVLKDILDTPVSPELVPASKNGESGHKTEQILGAYELHDFYLFHLVRLNESPREIFRKAKKVFAGKYAADEVRRTLELFLRRFFTQQFKRSCSPDGPAVSPLSLSPRSGWRVPSDASPSLWIGDLK